MNTPATPPHADGTSSTGVRWWPERLSHRRAIEALRSGVPNTDAVAALASGQPEVEDTVTALLTAPDGVRRGSLLLTAGFGKDKSHVRPTSRTWACKPGSWPAPWS